MLQSDLGELIIDLASNAITVCNDCSNEFGICILLASLRRKLASFFFYNMMDIKAAEVFYSFNEIFLLIWHLGATCMNQIININRNSHSRGNCLRLCSKTIYPGVFSTLRFVHFDLLFSVLTPKFIKLISSLFNKRSHECHLEIPWGNHVADAFMCWPTGDTYFLKHCYSLLCE